jgi:MFS family permease
MSSALILLTGIFTDRLGGTGCIVYGNIIYTIGSILIAGAAETRSYKFMIVGRVIASFGDIATQVAQYKVFSSWFPPSHGFASTLGFELGIKKVRLSDSSFRSMHLLTLVKTDWWVRW